MTSVFPINSGAKICEICGEAHAIQNRCSYDALTRRVAKLLQANKYVPALMEANKEATVLAETFRKLANDSAKAILICEKAVMSFPNGTEIWAHFQKKLEEAWPKESTNQDTEGKASAELSTSNETENKKCTEATPHGENTVRDFSPLILNATPAESPQEL